MSRNRTHYAVLGMLSQGEHTGYDLKKLFEERVAHFWSESLGQIYPALHWLAEKGWVTVRTEPGQGRPDRTVYRITDEGRRAFVQWLREPPEPERVRNELLLKLFFGPQIGPEILGAIESAEARFRAALKTFDGFESQMDDIAPTAEQAMYWKLALGMGQSVVRARARWCREARRTIQEFYG